MERQTTADTTPRAFGTDRSETLPDGTLVLECAVAKSWAARQGGSQTRSEFPGTAVGWLDEVYEVVAVEPLAGTAVRYHLAPWVPGHAIRRIERYDEATERARDGARTEMRTDLGKRRLAILLSPLSGHLPGAVQKKMEHDFGAPARAMTIISAFPLFLLGVVGLVAARIAGFSGEVIVPEWMIEHQSIMAYLAAESALRLISAFLHGEPMGSLLGVLAYGAWTRFGGPPAPALVSTSPAAVPGAHVLQDRYTMIEPLLALLQPLEQQQLELKFGFDPFKWGRRTSTIILWVAGANVVISVLAFLSRTDVFLDFAALVVGGFFVLEQISRRRKLAAGQPAGSILGSIVRPLARPLLEAAQN